MRRSNQLIRCFALIFFANLFFTGCGPNAVGPSFGPTSHGKDQQSLIDAIASLPAGQLTIAQVDDLMSLGEKPISGGPDLTSSNADIDNDALFSSTPTGSYLTQLIPNSISSQKVEEAAVKLVDRMVSTRSALSAKKPALKSRFSEVTKEVVNNEMQNRDGFMVYYHGFPNDFRLFQDVLRSLKSFEYLDKLNTTYPFRDFAFNDPRIELDSFLKDWWSEYLAFAKEKKVSPFPVSGEEAPGKSVGLTFYPDAIPYAQSYLLSTNVSFLGNTLSRLNSTVFLFLNSTSATGLDIVNWLIEKTLTPYLKSSDGQLDRAKFDRVLSELKEIFNRHLAQSGGQVAQIFVKKDIAPKVSFMAWNGGEPIWFSTKTSRAIYATNDTGKELFKPPNVFWPTTAEQIEDYALPNPVHLMNLYVENLNQLVEAFPVRKQVILQEGAELLGDKPDDARTQEFVTRDIMQARLLPNPQYFTDESVTGAKIFTLNPVNDDAIATYEKEIFEVVRGVISDFLANAKTASDFKEGDYLLKSAFSATKKAPEVEEAE